MPKTKQPKTEMKVYSLKAEVIINPALLESIGRFMSGCDLGVTGVEEPKAYSLSWTTTTKPTITYKRGIEKVVKNGLEKDGSRLISFKWI